MLDNINGLEICFAWAMNVYSTPWQIGRYQKRRKTQNNVEDRTEIKLHRETDLVQDRKKQRKHGQTVGAYARPRRLENT